MLGGTGTTRASLSLADTRQRGFVVSSERLLAGVLLVLGLLVGLQAVRVAVVTELADLGAAIGSLSQTYSFSGVTGHHASTNGSLWQDQLDTCDNVGATQPGGTASRCVSVCNVNGGSTVVKAARMRHWRALSLPPDTPLGLPGREQPLPEGALVAKESLQAGPHLANGLCRDELEHVIGLGLAHQLAGEVGADLRIRILKALAELVDVQIAVPEKVRALLAVHHLLTGGRIQHGLTIAEREVLDHRSSTPWSGGPEVEARGSCGT